MNLDDCNVLIVAYYWRMLEHEPKSTRSYYERELANGTKPLRAYELALAAYSDDRAWREMKLREHTT